jgi:hypothetical protein
MALSRTARKTLIVMAAACAALLGGRPSQAEMTKQDTCGVCEDVIACPSIFEQHILCGVYCGEGRYSMDCGSWTCSSGMGWRCTD